MPLADRPALIIHAGFHKTGTTSVQRALDENRAALHPWRILLRPEIDDLCAAAKRFARTEGAVARKCVVKEAQTAFTTMPPCPTVISAEDLTGLIPGRMGRRGYPAAIDLLTMLVQALPAYAPHIFLSTRSATPWLKSCHAHHLRHTRLCEDLASYTTAQTNGADLDGLARAIAAALAPVPVSHSPLDDTGGLPHGPLTPLLDLMGVPETIRNTLQPVPHTNASLPDHILDALLELNQSDLDDATLTARKRALIAAHRRTNP